MSTDDLAPRYQRAMDAMDAEHDAAWAAEQAAQEWSHDLADLTSRAVDAEQAAEGARAERDDAIRAALAAGVSVAAVTRATGLHRQRVYQIKDGRR